MFVVFGAVGHRRFANAVHNRGVECRTVTLRVTPWRMRGCAVVAGLVVVCGSASALCHVAAFIVTTRLRERSDERAHQTWTANNDSAAMAGFARE
jgi:hypothetical protein